MTSADVRDRARTRHVSLEVAARQVRYEAFTRAADDLRATHVATGHTQDDQAETVLMRVLRGTGTRGLAGVRARRGRYIRPLLECSREDLRRYLTARNEAWREDSSNDDVQIFRNRVRHELVPVIQRVAPGSIRALARLAKLSAPCTIRPPTIVRTEVMSAISSSGTCR